MNEDTGYRPAPRIRSAQLVQAALAAASRRCERRPHEPVRSAFAIFSRQIATDQNDLARERLPDGGGAALERAGFVLKLAESGNRESEAIECQRFE